MYKEYPIMIHDGAVLLVVEQYNKDGELVTKSNVSVPDIPIQGDLEVFRARIAALEAVIAEVPDEMMKYIYDAQGMWAEFNTIERMAAYTAVRETKSALAVALDAAIYASGGNS